MISQDQDDRLRDYISFSKLKNIGIYGYYSESRRTRLERLKDHLETRNLTAKIATDINIKDYNGPIESYEGEAVLHSERFYETSNIHIFILIPAIEPDNKLLDSVSMEFGWARKDRQRYVGIFIQEGFDLATLCEGAYQLMNDTWIKDEFSNIEEIFIPITKYCEWAIKEMYTSETISKLYDMGYHF